tara:strand:+ start:478 stop:2115 length:1638 start_codon:yes stop_codon:yes gene_type:complete
MKNKETLHIYTRVSTSSQVDGTSLEIQKQNGIDLSKSHGMDYKIWDEGHGSGFEEFSQFRPVFSSVLDMINDDKIKHLFVKDLSRLTRNEIDSYKINSLLLRKGVSLYTTDGKYDLSNLEKSMMYKILSTFNEYQVQVSRMKSIEGKVKRVKDGQYMLTIPFGYIRENGILKEHPINGDWLRKIFEWYKNGKSTYHISKELFKNGIKPPRSKSGMFPPETIQKILRRTTYIGFHTFTDKETGETITNDNLPLVDKDLFYEVGKLIDNEYKGGNNIMNDYLLRKVISCPCGTKMNCKGGEKDLYICRNQERTYQKRKQVCDDCVPMRSVKMSKTDDFVWETLMYVLSQSSLIKEGIKKEILGKKRTYGKRTLKKELNGLTKEKDNIDSMRLELEKDYYSGKMNSDRYKTLLDVVNKRDNEVDKELSIKNRELDSILEKDKWIDWIDTHLTNIDDLSKTEGLKDKKEVIQQYVNNITLDWNGDTKQHTLNISFKLPLVNDGINYIKGKSGQFLKDRKGFKKYQIIEGKSELTTPYYLQNSFNRHRFS